jgi:hypothetical protein
MALISADRRFTVDKSKILKNDVQEITEFQSIILG